MAAVVAKQKSKHEEIERGSRGKTRSAVSFLSKFLTVSLVYFFKKKSVSRRHRGDCSAAEEQRD